MGRAGWEGWILTGCHVDLKARGRLLQIEAANPPYTVKQGHQLEFDLDPLGSSSLPASRNWLASELDPHHPALGIDSSLEELAQAWSTSVLKGLGGPVIRAWKRSGCGPSEE